MTRIRMRIFKSAALAACSLLMVSAALAQTKTGSYAPASSGKITRPAPPALSTNPKYSVGSLPLFPADLQPGDGRQEVNTYCSICHSTRYITMQPPLPADTWAAEVNKMVKVLGAPVPDEASKKIIQYLQSHYTPGTRKH